VSGSSPPARPRTLEERWAAEVVQEWEKHYVPYPRMIALLRELIQGLGDAATDGNGRSSLWARQGGKRLWGPCSGSSSPAPDSHSGCPV
jgi:hypothetical protein